MSGKWIMAVLQGKGQLDELMNFSLSSKSKTGRNYKYKDGETVTITVTPVEETSDEHMDFTYNVIETKKAVIIKDVKFERATK